MDGCLGIRIDSLDGVDYDCEYEHAPTCEYCIYGPPGGTIDPKTGAALMTTIYPLPGPDGTTVYACPTCGKQYESMTEAVLCSMREWQKGY